MLELVCCDGCDNAYHEECLGVTADTLPDPWHCPHCASHSDGENLVAMSASENAATSCKRMKADEDLDYSDSGADDSGADAASTSSAYVKMPGMIAGTTAKPSNLSGQRNLSCILCPCTFLLTSYALIIVVQE